MIEPANFESIINRINSLKLKSRNILSNSFHHAKALSELLNKKECLCYLHDDTLFLLIPYHNHYYDLLFFSTDTVALKEAVSRFLSCYDRHLVLRVSVIGKESFADDISFLFKDCGFSLLKKLARTRIVTSTAATRQVISDFEKTASSSAEYEASLATEEDKEAVLSLLLEAFDYCADGIPEPDEILDNIRKQQVIVIKDENEAIMACHYFEVKNGVHYAYYEVVKKEYRTRFLLPELNKLVGKILARYTINRSYGWRDTQNKRLMKYALMTNEILDGVYVVNMAYKADGKR